LGEVAGGEGELGGVEEALGGCDARGIVVTAGAVGDWVPEDAEGGVENLPDLWAAGDAGVEEVCALAVEGVARPGAVVGGPDVAAEGLVDVLVEGLVLEAGAAAGLNWDGVVGRRGEGGGADGAAGGRGREGGGSSDGGGG
jgi:hypothetical protein